MNVDQKDACGTIGRAQKLPNELRTYSNDGVLNDHTVEKTDGGKWVTSRELISCGLNYVKYQRSNDAQHDPTDIQRFRECAGLQ